MFQIPESLTNNQNFVIHHIRITIYLHPLLKYTPTVLNFSTTKKMNFGIYVKNVVLMYHTLFCIDDYVWQWFFRYCCSFESFNIFVKKGCTTCVIWTLLTVVLSFAQIAFIHFSFHKSSSVSVSVPTFNCLSVVA